MLECYFLFQALKETEESQKHKIHALENEVKKLKQVCFFLFYSIALVH